MTYWWQYRADNPGGGYQEMTDPMGPYLKPDTNIAVPSGTPITAWDSGVITSVIDRGRGDAGLSVTMKLDHPPNGMAQYASFNYLGHSLVQVGQRITPGQSVGVAGSPYGVNFALGLGVSPVWGNQCPQCGSKQPLLDPRIILNALNGGKIPLGPLSTDGTQLVATLTNQPTSPTACVPWDFPCILKEIVGSDPFQRAGIMFFGLMLALIGIIILFVGHGGVQKTMKVIPK